MKECWRWFGPLDAIGLPEVAQTGASGVVTSLHEIPYGEVWPVETIAARKALIEDSGLGLTWDVVESLPVHEDVIGVVAASGTPVAFQRKTPRATSARPVVATESGKARSSGADNR